MCVTGWNREIGDMVTAVYYGQVVSGVITDKRVAYGGYVKFTLEIPSGFELFGTHRNSCIVREEDIV